MATRAASFDQITFLEDVIGARSSEATTSRALRAVGQGLQAMGAMSALTCPAGLQVADGARPGIQGCIDSAGCVLRSGQLSELGCRQRAHAVAAEEDPSHAHQDPGLDDRVTFAAADGQQCGPGLSSVPAWRKCAQGIRRGGQSVEHEVGCPCQERGVLSVSRLALGCVRHHPRVRASRRVTATRRRCARLACRTRAITGSVRTQPDAEMKKREVRRRIS
jgi:hypothetical protein